MFQSWLSIHSKSLKTIDIGYLSRNGGENKHLFDATLFPNLESLTLSRWQMGYPGELTPFTAESANFLGPKLKFFGWSFHIYDQHSESWSDFGEKEEAWLQELGEHAIARKAALKTVKIGFRPDYWARVGRDEYPWDRMDKIRDELLRPNRMDLVYSTPIISKEQWLKGMEAPNPYALNETQYEEQSESESDIEPWGQTPPGVHGGDIRDYFSLPRNTGS